MAVNLLFDVVEETLFNHNNLTNQMSRDAELVTLTLSTSL